MSLTQWGLGAVAFVCGVMLVHLWQQRSTRGRRPVGGGLSRWLGQPRVMSTPVPTGPVPRPAGQIPVYRIDGLTEATHTAKLRVSIERRMRFSSAAFERDCQPLIEALAEFVQMLPASECHHHAQPGGLWIHLLEVADAALTLRAGMELPPGQSTEARKRLEHRWSYAVLAAALLHDVGKPVTDVRVTMFEADPTSGRPWAALAGPMTHAGAHAYSVAFADPTERDYQAHQKLGAMLVHRFIPGKVLRWLAEDGDVLGQLLGYLGGDDPDGVLAGIIKRADSDSVRRNLLTGPRTRFASARTVPLIERLMEALRRMLVEGAALPLNRPGAAGWVHDGHVWFVCARLADEVRNYLATHESAQGVPGKERNDRLFDTWQEHGACRPAADGGAVWRVRVECEAWKSPDALTVLCFPLERLWASPAQYPAAMRGRILPENSPPPPAASGAQPTPAAAAPMSLPSVAAPSAAAALPLPQSLQPSPVTAAATAAATARPPSTQPSRPGPVASAPAVARPGPDEAGTPATAPGLGAGTGPTPVPRAAPGASSSAAPLALPAAAPVALPKSPAAPDESAPAVLAALTPAGEPIPAPVALPGVPEAPVSAPPTPVVETAGTGADGALDWAAEGGRPAPTQAAAVVAVAAPGCVASGFPPAAEPDLSLGAFEVASRYERVQAAPPAVAATTLGAPTRPHTAEGPKPRKGATPAAEAFMAWVAHGVGTGELTYNVEGALVHFVPQGCLLLSPEIFRRFVDVHAALTEGPVADLRAAHGHKAWSRLQNELAKSGWTCRNGDENLHYYAATKADGTLSRPASFYLLPQPQLFWNPVPAPNARLRAMPQHSSAKRLALPGTPTPPHPKKTA